MHTLTAFSKLVLLLSAVFVLSCKKTAEIPGFDLFYQRDFNIPAGIGIFDVHHFYIRNIPTQFQEYLLRNNVQEGDITQILTTKAGLEGVFGDSDYSFIEQVSVRAFDENDPNNFLEIAYRQPVPLEPGNVLPLIPSLADSKRFFKATRVSLDIALNIRKTTVQEMETRLSLQLRAAY